METIRVNVVEVDGQRLTVTMYNQLVHEEYRNDDGSLRGEPLGWITKRQQGCGNDGPHLLCVKRGELYDAPFVACPSFRKERVEAVWRAACACASEEQMQEPAFRAAVERKDTATVSRTIVEQARRIRDAYDTNDPRLDPKHHIRISDEVSQLEAQQQILQALPQLFVGR